jgi:hypothetical protein
MAMPSPSLMRGKAAVATGVPLTRAVMEFCGETPLRGGLRRHPLHTVAAQPMLARFGTQGPRRLSLLKRMQLPLFGPVEVSDLGALLQAVESLLCPNIGT